MSPRRLLLALGLTSALAFLISASAIAEKPNHTSPPGKRDLAGIWYRVVYNGAASEAGAIIVVSRADEKTWVSAPVVSIPMLAGPPQYPGFPPTDIWSPWVVQFHRTGVNTYEATSVSYYFNSQPPPGAPKSAWAGVCNGPAVLTDEDTLIIDWYCFASCNPCHLGCWNYNSPFITCDPARLWDPLQDPTTFPAQGVVPAEFRRLAMSTEGVPD